MTRRVRAVVLIGSLVAPITVLPSAADASPPRSSIAIPFASVAKKPKPTPKPTPTARASKRRDGLRVSGNRSEKKSRLARDIPEGTDGTKKVATARPRPARENGVRPTARSDLRLNTGNCSKVGGYCWTKIEPDLKVNRRAIRPVVVPRPQDVRWDVVRSETKNVIFPGLTVKVQPTDRTLVNLDTIVYTDDSKVSTTTVTLLGFPVVVEATPISYTWRFGDGSPELTTSTPGKAYPSKEITHKYMKRGDVSLTLTTNYAARFNVADTGWQYVQGTIPVTGPATALQVREAVPVLVDPDR